jgi:hypothetical protein
MGSFRAKAHLPLGFVPLKDQTRSGSFRQQPWVDPEDFAIKTKRNLHKSDR